MKTFNYPPDTVFIIMIKLSIFFIVCLLVLNELPVHGQITSSGNHSVHSLLYKVRKIYTSQIGIRESKPNAGPEVEKYLRYVNLSKGNPWCAAFVCWVLGEAGVDNPRTGWSPDLFGTSMVIWRQGQTIPAAVAAVTLGDPRLNGGRALYTPRLATDSWELATHQEPRTRNQEPRYLGSFPPKTGDVFGLYFPEKSRIAHVGFIDEWDGRWMVSVEGNTNLSGSRDGDGVYRKRRLIRSIYKVARYIKH